ncbi:hypothetical protein F5141DRAFT_1230926 [Pisolithus sp. B1]|nr:hypothetical protein F5141DRAFT_1230926 [Pisolithus sp. B1]
MKIGCNEVGSTSKSKTRAYTHPTAGVPMRLPQLLTNSSKRFIHPVGGLWMMKVHYNEIRTTPEHRQHLLVGMGAHWIDAKRCETAKKSTYGQTAASQQQHKRSRIKTDLRNVSRYEMRGGKASRLTISIPPSREIAKLLWNIANTYWRHGIPPGWTRNIETPSLFDTAALQQRYKARRRAHTMGIPKREVATTQRRVNTATTQRRVNTATRTLVTHGLEAH